MENWISHYDVSQPKYVHLETSKTDLSACGMENSTKVIH